MTHPPTVTTSSDHVVLESPRHATTYVPICDTVMGVTRELPRRLVGIWAHPDDEAYLSAGLMGRVVDAGGSVTLVTATSGEHGTSDPALVGTDAFAAHRRRELLESLDELGVTDVRMLGIVDGACETADRRSMVTQLAAVIDEVDPDVIVTFGPDGITGHPDHVAVSQWATDAWNEADRGAELLYATMTNRFLHEYAEMHDRLGLFGEYHERPTSVPLVDVALECSLTSDELVRKRRALARHASQTTQLAELIGEDTFASWWRNETFRAAARLDTVGSRTTAHHSTTRRVTAAS